MEMMMTYYCGLLNTPLMVSPDALGPLFAPFSRNQLLNRLRCLCS
jgi:hypothetical protein